MFALAAGEARPRKRSGCQNQAENFLPGRLETPTGFSIFLGEIITAPRSWCEEGYNVQQWSVHDRGGHFAALEEPNLLVQDIRDFFRPLR